MPQDKDRKRLVRQSMAMTGKRYTEALQELLEDQPRLGHRPDQPRRWVGFLGSPHSQTALALLQALPEDERRVAAIEGLQHPIADVRRRCCQLLDDMKLTEESIAAMTAALDDRDPHVRAAALHSLSCVRRVREVLVMTDTPWESAVALYRACGFQEVGHDATDTHFALAL